MHGAAGGNEQDLLSFSPPPGDAERRVCVMQRAGGKHASQTGWAICPGIILDRGCLERVFALTTSPRDETGLDERQQTPQLPRGLPRDPSESLE